MTTSLELGIDTNFYNSDHEFDDEGKLKTQPNDPLLLMIHSPYELPTLETQTFLVVDLEHDTFFVTPQLNKIDDTMMTMEPLE